MHFPAFCMDTQGTSAGGESVAPAWNFIYMLVWPVGRKRRRNHQSLSRRDRPTANNSVRPLTSTGEVLCACQSKLLDDNAVSQVLARQAAPRIPGKQSHCMLRRDTPTPQSLHRLARVGEIDLRAIRQPTKGVPDSLVWRRVSTTRTTAECQRGE